MSRLMFAAAAVAALLSGPALAEPAQTQSMIVPASHVDFNDRAQVQVLYARINAAARDACSLNSANPMLAEPDRACVDRAVADAVRRVNRPVLTAAFEASPVAGRAQSALAINDQ